MAINYRKIWNGVTVVPKAATASSLLGELETLSSDSKLYYHNGTSNSPVVTEAHSASLTNKTIVVANNTITTAASGNLVATELNAALAELDSDITTTSGGLAAHLADAVDAHDASAISVVPTGNLASTEVQAALVEHQGDIDTINTTLTSKVTGPASATDEAVARFDGTTGKLVQNSVVTITDAGIAAGLTGLTSSGTVSSTGILAINGALTEAITTDAAVTGANATITNPSSSFLRLTNASLSSVDMISSPISGEVLTIVNATGVDITINNDLGGTAANRILTGTKANLTLKDEASIIVKYDSTESRWMVIGGTGAGSGSGINYILSSDGGSTAGWATYADAAQATPVDGNGGSPNVTFTTSSSSPLRGTQSFVFTKDAANRQGQGVAYPITIGSADQASILTISFDYSTSASYVDIVSGNNIDSDMRMYVYDVTNSMLIECSQQNIAANTQGHYVGTFQTNSNSTSYRVIWHVASTNASAYTMKMDNIQVGPQKNVKGAVVTDWQSYTPTLTNFGTTSINSAKYRRVGDSVEIVGEIRLTAATTGQMNIGLPAGLVIDITKVDANAGIGGVFGFIEARDDSTSTEYHGNVIYNNTTSFRTYTSTGASASLWSATTPFTWATADTIHFSAKFPIAGWGSNLQLSEDTGNRLISAYKENDNLSGAAIVANAVTTINFGTLTRDTTASYNSSNGQYTIPETGFYFAKLAVEILWGTVVAGNDFNIYLELGGSNVINGGKRLETTMARQRYQTSGYFHATKGQVLLARYRSDVGTTGNFAAAFGGNCFAVTKVSSPQTLAGSESVTARYSTNAGQTVASGIVNFEDLTYDSHNAVTVGASWKFTAPMSGKYRFSGNIQTLVTPSVGDTFSLAIYKNNGEIATGPRDTAQSTTARRMQGQVYGTIALNKGDFIDFRMGDGITPAATLEADNTICYVHIDRIGN